MAFFFLLLLSCGIPTYEVLDPPRKYNPGSNMVGFQTPNNDEIDGYIIYYKIYKYNDSTISTDEAKFNKSYYTNSSSELPSGTTLPESLGFYKMGYIGKTNNEAFPHIPLRGSGHNVLLNFSSSINLSSTSVTDPVLEINGTDYTSTIGTPARGVIYSAISSYNTSNNTFKRFIKNYEFLNSSSYDVDLSSMRSSNGGSFSGITQIQIAFVAISYGISDANFEQLMSTPEYLGTITQNNFSDNSADSPELN